MSASPIICCPHCGRSLKVTPEAVGQTVECPWCNQPFLLQAENAAAGADSVASAAPSAPRRPVKIRAAPRPTGAASSRKTAPRRSQSRAMVWGVALVVAAAGGGGCWMLARSRTGGVASATAPARVASPASAAAPAAALTSAAATGSAAAPAGPAGDPSAPLGAARVLAFQWGGPRDDGISDIAARPDGRLVIVGKLASEQSVPAAAGAVRRLLDDQPGASRAFVAELAADGARLNWISLFGGDLIEPQRVALAPDGNIYVGGKAGARLAAVAGPNAGNFSKTDAAIVKIAADGARVLWVRAGGPNQDGVTGLAVDALGRVVWTAGTRGRGEAAYVLRRNADGTESTFDARPAGRTWAIDLHHSAEDLSAPGQFWAFYKKSQASSEGFDYDGPGGWAPVRFSIHGIRQGGQVVVLPSGDLIVSGTMQYDFRIQGQRPEPGFDLLLARYTAEGRLVWSTNLYQSGDSVHTPDQKAVDLAYSPATDDVYVLAKQHGSNVYRLKGDLIGDTGNLMISWLGRVDARSGALKAGYYFHHSRNTGYDERGIARPPPYPKLAGNDLNRVAVDARGRVYVSGNASPKAWTTPSAWRDWPASQDGGGNAAFYVFPPDLRGPLYATMIRGSEGDKSVSSGLALTAAGAWVGGANAGPGFPTADRPAWSAAEPAGGWDAALARFTFQ